MRWRARRERESYFIRCSPPVLLQQHRRGGLDVMLGDPSAGRVVAAPAGLRDLLRMCIRTFGWVTAGCRRSLGAAP